MKASGAWLIWEVREARARQGRGSRSRGVWPEVTALDGSASALSGPEEGAGCLLGQSYYSLTH